MRRHILRSGLLLGVFAVAGTGVLLWIDAQTRDIIAANERATLLSRLHQVLPDSAYDNNLALDTIEVTAPEALGSKQPLTVYRARKDGRPVAAVLTVVAPDGYNGAIRLLVGVYTNGEISGVRVVSHQETPGLGDAVEAAKSDWITRFAGRSLGEPPAGQWAVKPDGGAFDAFTGATVTPRAVVNAIRRALVYFEANQDRLFSEPDTER